MERLQIPFKGDDTPRYMALQKVRLVCKLREPVNLVDEAHYIWQRLGVVDGEFADESRFIGRSTSGISITVGSGSGGGSGGVSGSNGGNSGTNNRVAYGS